VEVFTGPRPAIRTVVLAPPSHAEEGVWVFLAACFVCLFVIYVIAFQRHGHAPDAARASQVLGFQVLFRDLPGGEQRVFRAMQEGMTEALRRRGEGGAWPPVESLANAGVPPFARDVLDKSSLAWSEQRDGVINQYMGIPAAGGGTTSFLILVQEPPPSGGETPSPGTVDEEHQLLPDGKLLHVTYWKRSPPPPSAILVADPALAGWQQIRITSPFEAPQ
jgi:Family of unknown function (DUF6162)